MDSTTIRKRILDHLKEVERKCAYEEIYLGLLHISFDEFDTVRKQLVKEGLIVDSFDEEWIKLKE